jgi:hypothetical protein
MQNWRLILLLEHLIVNESNCFLYIRKDLQGMINTCIALPHVESTCFTKFAIDAFQMAT